jgi:hypothetical protein
VLWFHIIDRQVGASRWVGCGEEGDREECRTRGVGGEGGREQRGVQC